MIWELPVSARSLISMVSFWWISKDQKPNNCGRICNPKSLNARETTSTEFIEHWGPNVLADKRFRIQILPYGQWNSWSLKLTSAIFYQIFIFHQTIALQKLYKMVFISSKKLFLFSRYLRFCISVFLFFFPASHCFRGCSKIDLKVYDVINCVNKNFITHFVWYLEKEKKVLYWNYDHW